MKLNDKWTRLAFVMILLVLLVGCTQDKVDEKATNLDEQGSVSEEPIVAEPILEVASVALVENKTSVKLDDQDYWTYEATDRVTKEDPIKGIYVSGYTAGINSSRANLITLADETEVNAFVIDVKSDSGRVLFDVDHPIINSVGAVYKAMSDIELIMDELYAHNIYPIARIVAFRDPFLPEKITDYAIKNQDGSLFYYHKMAWLNPYNQDTWAYIVDVAEEAAKVGFKEIQFDYIRFEATRELDNADFGDIDPDKTKIDIIIDFLIYANEELEPYDVKISADVFGTIITSAVDAKVIGQDYYGMAEHLDVICPMIYPSHYAKGSYGIPYDSHPDLHPYTIIYGSMMDSNEVLADLLENDEIIVRPWLQAFTASYLKSPNYMSYNGEEMRIQMQAAYDAGLTEWILWDPANTYPYSAFLPKE